MKFFVKSIIFCLLVLMISISISAVTEINVKSQLEQLEFFSGLSSENLDQLNSIVEVMHGKKGDKIIQYNKPIENLFFVLESDVSVVIDGKLLATVPANNVLGEIEFLDGHLASASVVLNEDSEVIQISFDKFRKFMDANPKAGLVIYKKIANILAERLRAMDMKK